MSHRPERKENDCLNCGAVVYGKFCHICGQENVEIKETFWHLVTHFVYDITHFDGKFFSTVKSLLLKPGFLSHEYMLGRRTTYLNPIKMYVFTSAFFFIFFFSVIKPDETFQIDIKGGYASIKDKVEKKKLKAEKDLQDKDISPAKAAILRKRVTLLNTDLERLKIDTTHLDRLSYFSLPELTDKSYSTIAQYDSLQQSLPAHKRDSWVQRQIETKKLKLNQKYGNDNRQMFSTLLDKFFHSFPQILFISLPVFAWLLKLLYIRRKQYYFGDHGIYAVHLYCAMFILIFISMILSRIEDLPYFNWVAYVSLFFTFYIIWYIYKSMKTFYQQSRSKTVLKFVLLMFTSFFIMSMLFGLFFIFSLYRL